MNWNNIIAINDYLPKPFGLTNTGVICYINTLMQCLMSITSFNKYMIESNKDIAHYYNDILTKNKTSSYEIATYINHIRNVKNYQYNISPHRQEDIHEGYMLLLELIGNAANKYFGIRYKKSIVCQDCEHVSNSPADSCPMEFYLEIPMNVDIYNYIMGYNIIMYDYKCDRCKSYNNIINYRIARIPPVIVLLFKYNQYRVMSSLPKKSRPFPNTLEFNSKYGPMKYRLASYANHSGGLNGGHYWANCLRVNENNRLSMYRINDNSYRKEQFIPSPEVYMLFYERIS